MESTPLKDRWNENSSGTHYAGPRFANSRRAGHDPKMVHSLLSRFGGPTPFRAVLDAPCGTGRLHATLREFSPNPISLDVSPSMLGAHGAQGLVQGSAFALPLADNSMQAIVCCRLFHHLQDPAERRSLIGELLRVGPELVVMSFWDAASWHAWRRRVGLRKTRNQDRRIAVSKADLQAWIEAEGGQILGYSHSMRGLSQQAFVAFRRKP
ncbi:MAG: methyltransferase domain-containing protein [Planctomycetes bacterium]|nr:methyltransferase domain-containing protein [Planctomycetota bacterium]